jgi:putative transposase
MAEIVRLTESSDWIDLGFVQRERTPKPLMELGIRLHVAGLSLSSTISELEKFGVQRTRKAVHDWVHKADLQPNADRSTPNHVALDETVIRIDGEQFWLYNAVDPATNDILHARLYPARTTALTEQFLGELREKHDVDDALFLVDRGPWLHAALQRHGLRFRHETHGNRNHVERVYTEVKRRTSSFSNTFSHVDPVTAENWLQTHATWWNSLN